MILRQVLKTDTSFSTPIHSSIHTDKFSCMLCFCLFYFCYCSFLGQFLSCKYGSDIITTARWLASTLMLCSPPKEGFELKLADGRGGVNITASINGLDWSTSSARLQITPAGASVMSLSPSFGTAGEGGTAVYIVLTRGL